MLIKPLSLREIQRNLGRPKSIEAATPDEVISYYRRVVKTVNSRISRLENKGIQSYALDRLRAELERPDAMTEAGYVKFFKSGDLSRYRGAIKAVETFLSDRMSTVTGIREAAQDLKEDFGEAFDLSEQEAADWTKATVESGLTQRIIYQVETMIGEYQEDNPEIPIDSDRGVNELIRLIDTHVIAVDEDIEPIIINIINRYKSENESSMLKYWERTGRRGRR